MSIRPSLNSHLSVLSSCTKTKYSAPAWMLKSRLVVQALHQHNYRLDPQHTEESHTASASQFSFPPMPFSGSASPINILLIFRVPLSTFPWNAFFSIFHKSTHDAIPLPHFEFSVHDLSHTFLPSWFFQLLEKSVITFCLILNVSTDILKIYVGVFLIFLHHLYIF